LNNTTWTPTTCDCKLEFNRNTNWVSTIRKCKLHKRLDGQLLLEAVLAQNRRFNNAFSPNNPTLEQSGLIGLAQRVNRLRIRTENLDNFVELLPSQQPLSFFQNLRRLLRLNP